MSLAALPNHNRVNDPLWRTLFHRYRHVITPLRYNGWTTDVELGGGEYVIRADLGDGTELVIASAHALPANSADVDGWTAVRQGIDKPEVHTAVYDSTPDGTQRHHGASLVPLFMRISELDAPTAPTQLVVSATHTSSFGVNHNQTAGIEAAAVAAARFFDWSERLVTVEGYQPVWERPGREGHLLALFENSGDITTVRVTPWHGDPPHPRP
ncbi:hypothetical protein [Streptomyces sp. 769]|uniref:hypothetical protein n=1 Tax=Streptomyces sp. 769 TaxID=1262452 RepID=UPI00057C8DBB|nr:hypothetical protein [Streptomyces sp. 769]AJC58612.1 hypothetical protein GZL_06039 [Streptomyces sp. 769]